MKRDAERGKPTRVAHGNEQGGTDIVEFEKINALIRLSEKLSHKINNLLTAVLNYTFILKSSSTDKKALSMHEKIEDGVRKAKDILQGLVDSSHHASGPIEHVDMEKELNNAVKTFFLLNKKSAAKINVKFRGPSDIRTNRRGLDIVLSSILQNSVEAGANEISIKGWSSDDGVSIAVSDNGEGIKKENLPLIFEPLFTTKSGRPGLGLYAAFNIISAIGGSISCTSRPGKETRFLITLPRSGK